MKCAKCGYLGFETGERCRNCGFDFSLLAETQPAGTRASAAPDVPDWLARLEREPDGVCEGFGVNSPRFPRRLQLDD
jgi:hypothetical protein